MIDKTKYFSPENQLKYLSASQIKSFLSCEDCALAEIKGEYEREKTTALLVGSYVDAYFEGSLDIFKAENPEVFKKDGNLKSDYLQAERIIARVERDAMFMKYMSGEKQVIMTGKIEGAPFKIKIDSYHAGKAIVDLKVVKDIKNIWSNGKYINFVDFWRYDIQGAIYQEIVRQNTGEKLPFFLAVATKEKETDIAILNIPQDVLDAALEEVKAVSPRYHSIKNGVTIPLKCGKCDYCKSKKVITEIIDYRGI
ncbi:MAG TPA: PD-(D/E)XK nuclease-like domain-containing protein [Oscillospiraceae bacterium]|nr:PD-(D/E)XK nuclease-like domain-containing protein [Oscillospiraceae bacterium]